MLSCINITTKSIIKRKILVVGDGGCGKTCLLNVFTRGHFPQMYEPTIYENYIHDIAINDKLSIELSLWDTAGQEELDRLRVFSYDNTHAILVCYSINNRTSLDNIVNRWIHELQKECPQAKMILAALKCDLRSSSSSSSSSSTSTSTSNTNKIILYKEGLAVAKEMNAIRYFECSAKHNRGVQECFEQAAKIALTVHLPNDPLLKKKNKQCMIM
ncbi:YIL118Wp-like protein [Cokeromyces recurvatus]|uniref:YIL118Wp-like protein n=1 Tax=Cokeromyces recurvatus TaxID=90255 RepID=UPI00221FB5D5|nr:YIL118Wp-like protein [Cokeromyces recurvatus]KAI7905185.1 YIL118Wp-like protein [Cokeromyces recurvatus]